MKIRITTDTGANALYVHLLEDNGTHSHSQELPNGWVLDWNKDGNLRGVEVLRRLRSVVVEDITDLNPVAIGIMDREDVS